MGLSLFSGGRCNSLWEPLWSESAWGPVYSSPARLLSVEGSRGAGSKVDWSETDEAHVFKADLPGVKKEDVQVELEDRTLSISGVRTEDSEQKGEHWHTLERSHGKFLRRFKLPSNAHADSISAAVEDGVLTVTIPKIQTKASPKRSIEVT